MDTVNSGISAAVLDNLDLDRAVALAKLSSIAGQPFSEFNVAVDRDTILAQYSEKGFPQATFEWSSDPAAEPHHVRLRYVIHEGSQQFVRQVVVTGNRMTRTKLIDRNITLNPGDPLSPSEMTAIQRRLYNLGVFNRVTISTQNGNPAFLSEIRKTLEQIRNILSEAGASNAQSKAAAERIKSARAVLRLYAVGG